MFVPLVYRSVYRVVFEKSTHLKESLKMMGMKESSYWSSWLVYYTVLNTVLVSLAVFVLSINIFKLESMPTMWFTLWLFGMSLLGLIMITQALFTTPRAAAIATSMIYFGQCILISFMDYQTHRRTKLVICGLSPQIAMYSTVRTFIAYQRTVGITRATWGVKF